VDEIEVLVEAKVNPTEDLEKVKRAVENIFWDMKFDVVPGRRGDMLVARAQGIDVLAELRDLLHREKIRAAARRVFLQKLTEKSIIFYLNKQVAFVSHISFSKPVGESPLGPIKVQIRCDNPHKLIEWLAPRTLKPKRRRARA
jgi:hypothetical protein